MIKTPFHREVVKVMMINLPRGEDWSWIKGKRD